MGRFGRSFQLVKQSWGVLMQDKELLILVQLGRIASADFSGTTGSRGLRAIGSVQSYSPAWLAFSRGLRILVGEVAN